MAEFTFDFGNKPKKLIADSALELIGKTPLVRLSRFAEAVGAVAQIIAKPEFLNPGGSVKDRIALAMIEAAERQGLLAAAPVIIEPTSGNTGIGLALVCAVKGYRLILTMPENMSEERKKILAAYGAELVLTPAEAGMKGAVEKAEELAEITAGSFIPGQFTNPANPRCHMETTAAEILGDTYGHADIFVAGVGSGGTLTGVGKMLKAMNSKAYVVAVEPKDSPVLRHGEAAPHKLQGIGANFIPGIYDESVPDEIFDVTAEDAYAAASLAARKEGLLLGISSGAALHAAAAVAARPENKDKTLIVLLPDGGERYLSGELFAK